MSQAGRFDHESTGIANVLHDHFDKDHSLDTKVLKCSPMPVLPPLKINPPSSAPSNKAAVKQLINAAKRPNAAEVQQLEQRRKAVQNNVTNYGWQIVALPDSKYRTRCRVCFQSKQTTHPTLTCLGTDEPLPHRQLGKLVKGLKPLQFCPFADELELYDNYVRG